MKNPLLYCIAIPMLMAGCATPVQITPVQIATQAEPYIRTATAVAASGAFLAVPIEKRPQYAAYGYLAGQAVYSLADGHAVQPEELNLAIVNAFPKTSPQLLTLATNISSMYNGVLPSIQGNESLTIKCIGDIGAGIEDACSSYIPKK